MAFATAFFSRVARLTSSGTGAYSHSRWDRAQLRHGAPPQQRIFLDDELRSRRKDLSTHLCLQYWQAMEIRCLRFGESDRSAADELPKASIGGWDVYSCFGKKTEGVEEEACIIAADVWMMV